MALALAARRPDLVDRAVIIATPAPNDQVRWMSAEEEAGLEMLRGLPPSEAHARLAAQLAQRLGAAPAEDYLSRLQENAADAAALAAPGALARVAGMLAAAFAQGTVGAAQDIAGYCLWPWGFEPNQVQARTLCLYGARDLIVPGRHGTWWQQALPEARLEMVPDAGHLLVLPMWHRVLSHLAPRRRAKTGANTKPWLWSRSTRRRPS